MVGFLHIAKFGVWLNFLQPNKWVMLSTKSVKCRQTSYSAKDIGMP